MIEHKQLFKHKTPDVGDCFRTCVACVLNCTHPTHVPHVFGTHFDWENTDKVITPEAHADLNVWLVDRGLRFFEYPLEASREQLGVYLKHYLPDQHVLVGCNSKNGGHSVVMRNDDYMWDPSLDDSGCVGPMDDGYYWIGLLIKDTSK